MIFGYSVEEARKTVISALMFIAALVAVFVIYDPGFDDALVLLVGSIFGVVAVFTKKNFTHDDLSKAVAQLQGAVFTVLGFLTTIPAGTEAKVTAVVLALLSFFPVFFTSNETVELPEVPTEIEDGLELVSPKQGS